MKRINLTEVAMTVCLGVIWLCYILFIGWWAYFTSKQTYVLNDENDINRFKGLTHNKFVNEAIDKIIFDNSKRSCDGFASPITVIERDHPIHVATMWAITDGRIKTTITGSRMTMTTYSL